MVSRGLYHMDKQGHPVQLEQIGLCKLNALFKKYTIEQIRDYFTQIYIRLIAIVFPLCSRVMNKRVEKIFVVIDMENVGMTDIMGAKL